MQLLFSASSMAAALPIRCVGVSTCAARNTTCLMVRRQLAVQCWSQLGKHPHKCFVPEAGTRFFWRIGQFTTLMPGQCRVTSDIFSVALFLYLRSWVLVRCLPSRPGCVHQEHGVPGSPDLCKGAHATCSAAAGEGHACHPKWNGPLKLLQACLRCCMHAVPAFRFHCHEQCCWS